MSELINQLLEGNQQWASEFLKHHPEFFKQLASGQSPQFLWIGCSDSRVPETEITGSLPGDIFVQRNIANLVTHADISLQSVIYYAVNVLKIKHIIVCGHYGCGGVQSVLSNNPDNFLSDWLKPIKAVYQSHRKALDEIADEKEKWDRLVELNVIEQVKNVAKFPLIQEGRAEGGFPHIHGWVYDIKNGLIKSTTHPD